MAKGLQSTQIHSLVVGHSCILRYNIVASCKILGSKAVSALSRAGTPLLPLVMKLFLRNTQFGNGGCKT